jgi:hypothetical protein
MEIQMLAIGVALAHIVSGPIGAQPQPPPPPGSALLGASGGMRTDRLSPKELRTWKKIVAIVMAEGPGGQPLRPRLRALWDAVDTSGHVVHVEVRGAKAPATYVAGRFAITRVDPEGRAHEGILILNLRAIDNASTGRAARRANGFIPFEGLGRKERYAEALGHELAHAVWSMADTERARLAQRLQGEMEQQMQMLLTARGRGLGAEIQEHVRELDRLGRVLEEPAEAAEVSVWVELRAGHRPR